MEKPILFNTAMVQAILEDKKTTTRRIIKRAPSNDEPCGYGFWKEYNDRDKRWYVKDYTHSPVWWTLEEYISKFSRYHVGDMLYVRETWTKLYEVDANGYTQWDKEMIFYAADGYPDIELRDSDGFLEEDQRIKWKPSIHMPRSLARIFLRVKDVRIERLHEMKHEDFLSEGIREYTKDNEVFKYGVKNQYTWQDMPRNSQEPFIKLWDSTLKKEQLEMCSWNDNPWVFVIEFERVAS